MTVGDCVTDIDRGVGDSLRILNLGNSVQHIGTTAFQWNSINNLVIPDSVSTIGEGAFGNNYGLITVEIGSGVTSIGNSAFRRYSSSGGHLETVTVKAITPPSAGNNIFYNQNTDFVIYVPAESLEAYKSASGWSTYASRIQAIPNS